MGQFHFDPESYLRTIRAEVPAYDELQRLVAEATRDLDVRRFLDLGVGLGETSRAVLALHPNSRLVGMDVSPEMIALAAERLPIDRVEALLLADIGEELPPGPFDLVASALAVHHLPPLGKQALFGRVHAVLRPGGRFVLADVVVPENPADAVTPLSPEHDLPDSVLDISRWLESVGFVQQLNWLSRDLAVFLAARQGSDAG